MSDDAVYSVQFRVIRAVVQTLGGKAQNAHRCRLKPFSKEEVATGADNVIPDKEDNIENSTDDTELSHQFHIRHMVSTEDGVDRIADARFVRAYKLLMASPTLGGLVRRVRFVGRKWEMEQAELEQMALVATYEVEYSTTRNDPTVSGY